MKRINARQAEIDDLKRNFELAVVANGGWFEDIRTRGGGIKSYYFFEHRREQYVWHSSYSDRNAKRLVGSQLVRTSRKLGIDKSKHELGLIYYVNSVHGESDILNASEFFN